VEGEAVNDTTKPHYGGNPIFSQCDYVYLPIIDGGQISDGYHTFDELYDHRCLLFALYLDTPDGIHGWKARKHADGSEWEGWFIAGIELVGYDGPVGTITYHIPNKFWNLFHVDEREHAPEWDGHTSADVIARMIAGLGG
jgi:hypothetical protein